MRMKILEAESVEHHAMVAPDRIHHCSPPYLAAARPDRSSRPDPGGHHHRARIGPPGQALPLANGHRRRHRRGDRVVFPPPIRHGCAGGDSRRFTGRPFCRDRPAHGHRLRCPRGPARDLAGLPALHLSPGDGARPPRGCGDRSALADIGALSWPLAAEPTGCWSAPTTSTTTWHGNHPSSRPQFLPSRSS